MSQNPIAEAVIKRDRNIVLTGLAAVILVAAMLQQYDHAAHGSEGFMNLFLM